MYITRNVDIKNSHERHAFGSKLNDFFLDTHCFFVLKYFLFRLLSNFCTFCLVIVLIGRPFNVSMQNVQERFLDLNLYFVLIYLLVSLLAFLKKIWEKLYVYFFLNIWEACTIFNIPMLPLTLFLFTTKYSFSSSKK